MFPWKTAAPFCFIETSRFQILDKRETHTTDQL